MFRHLVMSVYSFALVMNVFTGQCNVPLGVENGLIIRDEQLSAFSAYNNDSSRFGAHRARLRITTWPPGYRADKSRSADEDEFHWIRIDLEREQIVTGIATQGYGDASVPEWVKSYRLMYASGREFAYFVDSNGETKVSFVCQQIIMIECLSWVRI